MRYLIPLLLAIPLSAQSPAFLYARVTLEWDRNPEPDISHYRVWIGSAKDNLSTVTNVGNVTSYVHSMVIPGTNWFAVSAVNVAGLESDLSEVVSWGAGRPSQVVLRITEYTVSQQPTN